MMHFVFPSKPGDLLAEVQNLNVGGLLSHQAEQSFNFIDISVLDDFLICVAHDGDQHIEHQNDREERCKSEEEVDECDLTS